MMDFIRFIFSLIFSIGFIYLGIYSLYLFVFSVTGRVKILKAPPVSDALSRFVIYICAYKEDAIILNSAAEALKINYPGNKFHVCVIADSMQPETIARLREMPLQVVEVVFENSTKSKALHKAIENTYEDFDAAVVFDIDNIAAPDFLYHINNYLHNGNRVIQGHRVAKNTETPVAVLDAISEEINNHIFRKAQRVFNLSAAIIGSGMALEYRLFKETMGKIDAIGGFDKEMGLILTRQGIQVAYADEAFIYDEKVSNPEVFKKQRKRWLAAQFNLFKIYGKTGLTELFKHGNFDYFNEIYQTAILPRVLMLGLMPFMLIIAWLTNTGPGWGWWLTATVLCYTGILAAVPPHFFNKKLLAAVLKIPMIFFTMLALLFKLKGANKKFIHTPHST